MHEKRRNNGPTPARIYQRKYVACQQHGICCPAAVLCNKKDRGLSMTRGLSLYRFQSLFLSCFPFRGLGSGSVAACWLILLPTQLHLLTPQRHGFMTWLSGALALY